MINIYYYYQKMATERYVYIRPSVFEHSSLELELPSGIISGKIEFLDTIEFGKIEIQNMMIWNRAITGSEMRIFNDTIARDMELRVKTIFIEFENVNITWEDFTTISQIFEDINLKSVEIQGSDINIVCFNVQDMINARSNQELINELQDDPYINFFLEYSALAWDYISSGNIYFGGYK